MSGTLRQYEETITAPARFPEHCLCADVPEIDITNLEAFHKGVQNGGNDKTCCIAFVRGPSEIALGAIITRPENTGLSKPFQIIWTCCRSPIQELVHGTVYPKENKVIKKQKVGAETTSHPSNPEHDLYNHCADGLLTVIDGTDVHQVGA